MAEKYIRERKIGKGTYGEVYEVVCRRTKKKFALKEMLHDEEDGIPASAIREVSIMSEFKHNGHPNVLALKEVIHNISESRLSLVFEYMELDLRDYIDYYTKYFSADEDDIAGIEISLLKSIVVQMFRGMNFCHQHFIMHRDIKPSNILLRADGVVKLADFGLARTYGTPDRVMSHDVVTLWYRAPEIMLGTRTYDSAVDVWGCGCILAEMVIGHVLFEGDSEIDQIFQIFRRLGTPNNLTWPGVESFIDYSPRFPQFKGSTLAELELPIAILHIVENMLQLDPHRRGSMQDQLNMPFFDKVKILPLKLQIP